MFRNLLYIGAGGFIGSVSRYLVSYFMQSRFLTWFPVGTFTVNIIGCFVIGAVYQLVNRGSVGNDMRLFIVTGILGGFTTFSAFSLEAFEFIKDGLILNALLYILASVILSVLAVFAGAALIKLF